MALHSRTLKEDLDPGIPCASADGHLTGSLQRRHNTNSSSSSSSRPLGFELKRITYHPYLESRGISKETDEKFGVGKRSMAGRIVIPIRTERGELVAYAGRALNGEKPKYKLPAGVPEQNTSIGLYL